MMKTIRRSALATALIALFSSFSALAQANSCKTYLAPTPQKLIIEPGEGVKAMQIEERRKLIGQINRMIAADLRIPRTVVIELQRKGADAYHTTEFPQIHKIVVPYQFELKTAIKHPNHSAAILAHEYGHGILAENLNLNDRFKSALALLVKPGSARKGGNHFADYLKWDSLRTEAMQIVKKGLALADAREARAAVTTDPNDAELAAIDAELKKLAVRLTEIETEMDSLKVDGGEVFEMLGGFHEFFADVVAVVFYNDPKVIWRGLYSPKLEYVGMSPREEHEIFKSFTLRRFDKNVRIRNFSEEEIHVALTPVRTYAWDYYLNNPLYRAHKSKMLKTVFDSIVDEVIERGKTPNITPSPEAQNQRLIERLDANFAKLKKSLPTNKR